MTALTNYFSYASKNDKKAPGWLTVSGVVLLAGTVFHELVGIDAHNLIELATKGLAILSAYL